MKLCHLVLLSARQFEPRKIQKYHGVQETPGKRYDIVTFLKTSVHISRQFPDIKRYRNWMRKLNQGIQWVEIRNSKCNVPPVRKSFKCIV